MVRFRPWPPSSLSPNFEGQLRGNNIAVRCFPMSYSAHHSAQLVEITLLLRFKSHYPPQFFTNSSALCPVKIPAGSFGCTQVFLCLTCRRHRAVPAGANEHRILLPHFMLALGTDIVPNFGFAHFFLTTNCGAFRAMHSL